jgi:hypothetical protein
MFNTPVKILAFSAVVEVGTALVLIFDPAFIVALLLGASVSGIGIPLGRCFGVALLALGFAAWPGRSRTDGGASAFRAMLLWPAVVLHAVVALLLGWTRRNEHLNKANTK